MRKRKREKGEMVEGAVRAFLSRPFELEKFDSTGILDARVCG